jgi:hypothetical protein
MSTEAKINTQLQRGLLKAHAEVAERRGLWLRHKDQKQFRITPTHFIELLDAGRFETTSPNDWEMYEQEKAVEVKAVAVPVPQVAQPVATPPPPPRPVRVKVMEKNTTQTAGLSATRAILEKIRELENVDKEYEALGKRRTALVEEIQRQTARLAGAPDRTVAVPTATTTTSTTPTNRMRFNGTRRVPNRRTKNYAKGVRKAILAAMLERNGKVTSLWELAAALSGTFRQAQIVRNLPAMMSDGLLRRAGTDPNHYELGPRWEKSRSAREIADERKTAVQ